MNYELVQIVKDFHGITHAEGTALLKENGLDFDLLLISVKDGKAYCWKEKRNIKPYTS